MTSATRLQPWHAASILTPSRREVVQDEQLATHRIRITSPWRGLTAGCQGLIVLAHPRYGDTYAQLPAWFGMRIATVCRYVHEAVAIPDGTPPLQISDRVAADRPYCSRSAL
ncbi:transposase family protein [Streptomyces sp. NPDC005263]|uniref:transposase family protein n=1 Tax=Streptomyces sp. NPDC005263 TaxID=3364711 RepID=UPI0036A4B4C1